MSDITGYMSAIDLETIRQFAKSVGPGGVIVEIGSLMGRSTANWASNCDPTVTVLAIDEFPEEVIMFKDLQTGEQKLLWPFDSGYEDIKRNMTPIVDPDAACGNQPLLNKPYRIYEEFLKNTKEFKNVKHLRGKSPYNINYSGEDIDLFFLDAAHHNPNDWDNIKFFVKFVKQGGLLCGHDWSPEHVYPDVNFNISRLEEIYQTKAVKYPGSIWSITVTKDYKDVKDSFDSYD